MNTKFQNNKYWSVKKFEKINDDLGKMSTLINEFLILNNQHPNDENDYSLSQFWFEGRHDEFFCVYFEDINNGNSFNRHFADEQLENLLQFMNDPEFYKETKKYNI